MNWHGPKSQIVDCGKHLYDKKLVTGYDGNISFKKEDGTYLVTKTGICKKFIQESDIINVNKDGTIISGPGKCTTEFSTHTSCYDARPNATYVVHAHPLKATSLTFMDREYLLCKNIVPEVTSQIGPIHTVPYFTPGSEELATAVQEVLVYNTDCNFIMLKQHGIIGIGTNLIQICMHIEKIEYLSEIIFNTNFVPRELTELEVKDLKKYKYPTLK